MPPGRVAAAIAGLSLALTGLVFAAAANPADGQLRDAMELPLAPGQRVSQSFLALTSGLASLTLPATASGADGGAILVVRLVKAGPFSTDRSTNASAKPSPAAEPRPSGVTLAPADLVDEWRLTSTEVRRFRWRELPLDGPASLPAGTPLKIELWMEGAGLGALSVWTSEGNAYPASSLAVDGRPQPVDLAFRVDYRPGGLEKARWLAATAGFSLPFAWVILFGIFASGLGAAYTVGRLANRPDDDPPVR